MEKRGNVTMIVVIVLVLIIVGGIGYYLGSSGSEKKEAAVVPEQTVPPQNPAPPANNQETVPVVTPPAAPISKNWTVKIMNYTFVPAELTIGVGDSVTWINMDVYAHTPVADDVWFVSRPLNVKGDSFTFTFVKAGTHTYYDKIHPEEKGVIIVQ